MERTINAFARPTNVQTSSTANDLKRMADNVNLAAAARLARTTATIADWNDAEWKLFDSAAKFIYGSN